MFHPNSPSPCRNAALRASACGLSASRLVSTPMRRIRSGCCARAASGHAAAAPPSAASNSRRPMVTVIRPSRVRCVKGTIPRTQGASPRLSDKFFLKEVTPKIGYPTSAPGPPHCQKSFQAEFPGMSPESIFEFRAPSPRGVGAAHTTSRSAQKWQCFLQPTSLEMRCTVPVPSQSDFATVLTHMRHRSVICVSEQYGISLQLLALFGFDACCLDDRRPARDLACDQDSKRLWAAL